MTLSNYLKSIGSNSVFFIVLSLLVTALSGCANVRVDRSSVEKMPEIQLVQVVTPALEVPTFMQAALKSGALGGIIVAAIVQGEEKSTLSTPQISDIGALVTEDLKQRLSERASWWPRMTKHERVVPGNYVYPGGDWLRVEVFRYEIAPTPLKTLYVGVQVSLWRSHNQGDPLWIKRIVFSGIVHGGEKIIADNLPNDPSQLNREIERAADWLAKEIAADVQ